MVTTLILIKPNGVQRRLIGTVIAKFEKAGLKLKAMKYILASAELLEEHYCHETSEPYFPLLIDHMSSGPIVAMVWEGTEAVKKGRLLIGETEQVKSKPGTIRGDLCIHIGRNIVHGSDSKGILNHKFQITQLSPTYSTA